MNNSVMTIDIKLEYYVRGKWASVIKSVVVPCSWADEPHKIDATVDYIATTNDAYAWGWKERN